MRRVALIPARGSSRGIPRKNIRSMCGRPLLYWVCKAANDCAAIDAVYVSTEDAEIAAVARGLGLEKLEVVSRDEATATDQASTESAMLDFAARVPFDAIALIQATSPLLDAVHLDAAWRLLDSGTCDSVLSVAPQHRFRWNVRPDGLATPENYDPLHRPRRQESTPFHVENGALYVTTRERLIKTGCRISGRIGTVTMEEASYFEVDSLSDWQIVEGLLAAKLRAAKGGLAGRLGKIRLVASDVDGCLTDSGMYYGEEGDELKKFNTRDGMGFRRLRQAGLLTGIITAEKTALVERRAKKLDIAELHQGATDKVRVMEEILAWHELQWDEVAYLGDDVGDVDLLRRVGVSACPADAIPEVRALVDLCLTARGGEGALRELAELVLAARDSA